MERAASLCATTPSAVAEVLERGDAEEEGPLVRVLKGRGAFKGAYRTCLTAALRPKHGRFLQN